MIDLFSGGGGFSYAAEKLVGGFETIQFVEIDPYCQKVLKKHWPTVPIHDDIKTYKPEPHSAHVVCGGFPCQDLSVSGKRLGITKETRSGLFYELMRVVCVVRPKYVIMENVAAILNNGMGIVLGELCKAGYNAEWATFRASDYVGACHHRNRWWLIAYPNDNGSPSPKKCGFNGETSNRTQERQNQTSQFERSSKSKNSTVIQRATDFTNTDSIGMQREVRSRIHRQTWNTQNIRRLNPNWRQYGVEPTICRDDDGIASGIFTNRTERLKLLGNGLVPQCAAIPLQRILDLENDSRQT